MAELIEDIKPEVIWRQIGRAGELLDLDPADLCGRAGLSSKQQDRLRGGLYVPSLSRLTTLAEKTGLPIEFYLSDSEPTVSPARFRSGSPQPAEEEGVLDHFWQRREILHLGSLGDFLVDALSDAHAKAVMRLRRVARNARQDPSGAILEELGIRAGEPPIGPRLEAALDRLGVVRIRYPFYTRAKISGLSWWQRGVLPLLAVGTGLSARRSYFTTAHELGHLLLHLDPAEGGAGYRCRPAPSLEDSSDPRQEREANRIAAELLMPGELKARAGRRVAEVGLLKAIGELSSEWDLSRQAISLRLVSWELAERDDIRSLFAARKPFARGRPRPPGERFGSVERTREMVRKIYEAGASARYVAWLTKIPLEDVLGFLGRATPQEVVG